MNKLIFLGSAGLALTITGPVFAADLPPMPVKASFVERFTWTSCYLGAHLGGAWAKENVTDPVLLVQDSAGLGGPLGRGAVPAPMKTQNRCCGKNRQSGGNKYENGLRIAP